MAISFYAHFVLVPSKFCSSVMCISQIILCYVHFVVDFFFFFFHLSLVFVCLRWISTESYGLAPTLCVTEAAAAAIWCLCMFFFCHYFQQHKQSIKCSYLAAQTGTETKKMTKEIYRNSVPRSKATPFFTQKFLLRFLLAAPYIYPCIDKY